jgi:hypothetical protein
MAQLLAPYNNSMRLGQGFNSYTQQICLDRAVLPDTVENREKERKTIVISSKMSKPPENRTTTITIPASNDKSAKHIETSDEKPSSPAADADHGKKPAGETVPGQSQSDHLLHPPHQEETEDSESTSSHDDEPEEPIEVYPWVKPQIVTYSSRFVDKLSDVAGRASVIHDVNTKLTRRRCNERVRVVIDQNSDHRGKSQWFVCG